MGIRGRFNLLYDSLQPWIVLFLVGILTGLVAACINVSSDWLNNIKSGYCKEAFYLSKEYCCWEAEGTTCDNWISWSEAANISSKTGSYVFAFFISLLFVVIFSFISTLLVVNFAPYAVFSGIPEIKTVLSGIVFHHLLTVKTLIIKSVGLCLVVGAGLWAGREGPLVHVACCCTDLVMKLFSPIKNNEARKREFFSAGAAAGISVAFAAPIGGVLFSIEQASSYLSPATMWHSFVCAMVAAVALQSFTPFKTGKDILFEVNYSNGWTRIEIIPFTLLGIFGGLFGAYFIKLNAKFHQLRKKWFQDNYKVLEVVVVALITGFINYGLAFNHGTQFSQMTSLFQECDATNAESLFCNPDKRGTAILGLLLNVITGFILLAYTVGIHIPSGIMLPSLFIGASFGRAMGLIIQAWQESHPNAFIFQTCSADEQCITPGVYAVIGAASALGGVTRMTVSVVVILFEVTGALSYVLPIMIGVIISKWVADAICKEGVYESWININGYPFLNTTTDEAIPDIKSKELMTSIDKLVVIFAFPNNSGEAIYNTIGSLKTLLSETDHESYPIVKSPNESTLLGLISRTELEKALEHAVYVCDYPEDTPCKVTGNKYPLDISRSRTKDLLNSPQEENSSSSQIVFDLQPWAEGDLMTISQEALLKVVLMMFQTLGLRYLLFTSRGDLKGLLTKKDIWSLQQKKHRKHTVDYSGGDRRLYSHTHARSEDALGLLDLEDEESEF